MKMHAALKRGLALVLTLAMMVSIVYQGGYMHAHAENEVPSVGIGQLIAENYELTDAEEALYSSGLLAGESYGYVAPTDAGLVSVDTESKTITAGNYTDSEGNQWNIDRAEIVVGEEVKETVTFTGNTATYTYDGNAFSVRVYYALTLSGMKSQVEGQIAAAEALKAGLVSGQTLMDQEGNLYIVEVAMPDLVALANTGVAVGNSTAALSEEAKAAITALNGQMTANGGVLDLSVERSAYAAAPSKVNYILTSGEAMLAKVTETKGHVAAIESELAKLSSSLDSLAGFGVIIDEATINNVKTLSSKITSLNNYLQEIIDADWSAAGNTSLVKSGITADEYVKLDSLLNAVESFTAVEVKDTLFVTETYIQYNLSMFDVDVTVVLTAATGNPDDATLYEISKSVADTATLSEGASAAEIQKVIDDAITAAQAGWASEYLTENYVVVTEYTVPGALTEDLEYTIVYAPKNYTVTLDYYGGDVASDELPYGYQMVLSTYYSVEGKTDKVYDYTVNGVWKAEGSVITIEGDTTIVRTEGEPYAALSLYELIAEQYCADDATAYAALTSGALKGDIEMGIRKPALADLVSVVEGASSVTVTAATHYAGDATGLTWKPVECEVTSGDMITVYPFNGGTTVTFFETDYDRVEVSYKLDLSPVCSDAEVLAILNTIEALAADAKDQTSALTTLVGKMSDMESLTGAMMSALKGMINDTRLNEDPAEDARLKELFLAQVETIQKTCMQNDAEAAANGNVKYLYLLKQMEVYTDANNGGLDYYYQNATAIQTQVSLLGDSLTAMLAGENEKAALSILLNAANYGQYAEKIENMADMLATVKANLSSPADAIDVISADLEKLTDALSGTAKRYTTLPESLSLKDSYGIASSKNVTLSVDYIVDGKGYTSRTITIMKVDTVTEVMVNNIKSSIESNVASLLGGKAAYYVSTYDVAALDDLVGKTGSEAVAALAGISFSWTAKEYTVKVDGVADQTITINNLTINLPASASADVRYDYIIGGQTVSAGKYAFTADQLDTLFVGGSYTVERVVVDMARENLISFVDDLNKGTKNTGITFALVENMGKYSVVMKLDTADMAALQSAAMGMVTTLANYDYIGIGGEGLKFVDENGGAKFSIQSVINAILNSGMTGNDLINAVNANTMSKIDIVGTVISNYPMTGYGGKLAVSTMEIANAESSYPLYITLGSVQSALAQGVNAYEQYLQNYIQFVCSDGAVNLSVTLPDKAYQAYLAALLLTEDITLADVAVTDIDTKIAYEFLSDIVPALEDETVTLDSWLNTLEMMGVISSTDIAYKNYLTKAYNALCKGWNGVEFVNDDLAAASGNLAIKSFIDSMAADYKDLLGMIVEYETGVELSATLTLANTNTYNAIYFDNAAGDTSVQGMIKKAGLTTLSGSKTFDSYAVLVLTDDVTADLTFNRFSIINLNGHTINGDITCNGKTFIVDTSVKGTGAINGTITGTHYMSTEEYYTLTEDANGNLTVTLNADTVVNGDKNMLAAATLGMDVLADLVFNGYVNGELYVDGNMIYDVELEDGIALYLGENTLENAFYTACSWFDNAELSAFVDAVADDLTDFAGMAGAAWVDNTKVIASYDLTTAPWNISATGANDGEYVTISVGGNDDEKKDITLTFAVAADDTQEEIQKALDILAETVSIDVNLAGTQTAADKTLSLGWTADGCVTVDLTGNEAYAKALCAILACGSDAMKAAVQSGDMDAMKTAFNAMTVAEAVDAIQNYDVATVKALSGVNNATVLAVGNYVSKLVNALLNRIGDIESTRTLGSFYKTIECPCGETHTGYGATRSDWSRAADVAVKSYTLDASVQVDFVTVMVNVWAEEDEECKHNLIHVERKEPTCTENGNVEYWYCPDCGMVWLDEALTKVSNMKNVVLLATGHNYEFCVCTVCGDVNHSLIHVERVEPTCTENGNVEYWYCPDCGIVWLNADLTQNTNMKKVVLLATGHNYELCVCTVCGDVNHDIIHVEAKEPTCTENGNVEYWYCPNCGLVWLDEDLIHNTNMKNVVKLATGHSYVLAEGEGTYKAPTCTEDGYQHYVCAVCGDTYIEILPATGHDHSAEWSKNETGHWHECACGDAIDFAEHTYGDWMDNNDGTKTHTCDICGYEETVKKPVQPGKTGDEAPILAMTGLMVTAAAAAAVLVLLKKRERN